MSNSCLSHCREISSPYSTRSESIGTEAANEKVHACDRRRHWPIEELSSAVRTRKIHCWSYPTKSSRGHSWNKSEHSMDRDATIVLPVVVVFDGDGGRTATHTREETTGLLHIVHRSNCTIDLLLNY